MKDKQKNYCGVLNCLNNSTNSPGLSYFRIPKDSQRAAVWLEKIHKVKNNTKKILVCEVHFEKRFVNENDTRKRLVGHAVPTLLLPEKVDLECTPDLEDDCSDDDFDESDNTPIVRAPKRKKTVKKKTTEDQDRSHEETITKRQKPNDEDDLVEILYLHNRLRERSNKEKYTDEFKFYALKLYLKNPATYKVMQSLLNLPSISTLYRLFIPSTAEVYENLMIALKIKVEMMSDIQKECAVCIGSIELKPSLQYNSKADELIGLHDVDGVQGLNTANTALVIMVRGLIVDWKQAVAVAFISRQHDNEDVRMYIIKTIEKLFDIGLNVRVFISDPKSDIDGITKERKINVNNPFFLVDGKKVYYMYEPRYLFSEILDNLMTYDIHFKGSVAKWKHIVDCYDYDSKKALRLAPNLTAQVINGDHKKNKERIKSAAEVFNMTTANAISAYADFKVIEPSSKLTVEFIVMMNNMFKILTYEEQNSSGHTNIKFLKEIMSSLGSLRFTYSEKEEFVPYNAQFIKRMEIILSAFVSLNEDLKQSFIYPVIKGLNRDCLQTFFDKVRNNYRPLPTCEQILSSLTKLPIFNVFQFTKKQSSDNLHSFLTELKKFSDVEMYCESAPKVDTEFTDIDLNVLELPRENALQYLAAYLLYEGYQQHIDCEAMKAYVFENSDTTDTDNTVILPIKTKDTKNIKPEYGNAIIVVVPPCFREFIESLELILKLYFETEFQRHPVTGLRQHLLQDKITFSMPCTCFPLDFIKGLYIKYRFHVIFKYNKLNIDTETNSDRRTSFVVNDL